MLWSALMMIVGGVPAPAPTYLICEWTNDRGTWQADVALDEANQRATIGLSTGHTVTRPALFSPSEVKVPDEPNTWVFSRTDLTFHRTVSFRPGDTGGDTGTCKIKPVPAERAF